MIAHNGDTDRFVISDYLDLLQPSSKEKGKYICPVCQGHNLSINKDGKRYYCFDGCQGNQIAYKLRELNGEFSKPKTQKPLLQVYNSTTTSDTSSGKTLTKLKTSMSVLAFLRETFPNQIQYNVRTRKVEINNLPIEADCVRAYFGDKFNVDITSDLALQCLLYLGKQQSYDPVKTFLLRCNTQPMPLEKLATIIFGCTNDLYNIYFRKWLIGCVARVFEPGCKFDEVLVLHGRQGCGKSSFFKVLSNGYFSDCMGDKLDKDDLAILRHNWINEWGELDNLTAKVYCGQIKAFLSRQSDLYRAPYGKDMIEEPRRSVIVGSTNRDDFLKDPTGNRRFWIIPVLREIDLDIVDQMIDSIWSAALAAYHGGESWHLPREFWPSQARDNENYEAGDPWRDILEPYLEAQKVGHVLISELMEKLQESGCSISRSKTDEMKIADVLRKLGWEKKRKLLGEVQRTVWVFSQADSQDDF